MKKPMLAQALGTVNLAEKVALSSKDCPHTGLHSLISSGDIEIMKHEYSFDPSVFETTWLTASIFGSMKGLHAVQEAFVFHDIPRKVSLLGGILVGILF